MESKQQRRVIEMSEAQIRSQKTDANTIYNYIDTQGFEIRQGVDKNYNYRNDDERFAKFELRIRHEEAEQIEALLDKIKEWLGITLEIKSEQK